MNQIVLASWRWMWWSYNNNVTTCIILKHGCQLRQKLRICSASLVTLKVNAEGYLNPFVFHLFIGFIILRAHYLYKFDFISETFACTDMQEL